MVGGYMTTAEKDLKPNPLTGFYVMLAGRVVFGFGGESMTVA